MRINARTNAKSIERSSDQNKIGYELQKQRIKILQRRKTQYENNIIKLTDQIRMQDQQLFMLDDQVNNYKIEVQRLKEQLQARNEESLRLEEYVQLIEKLREQKHFLNQKIQSLRYQLKEQQNKCYQLNHQNEVLNSRVQELFKEIEKLKADIIQQSKCKKQSPTVFNYQKPLMQREILQLSHIYYELTSQVKRYQKAIAQIERDEKIKRKQKGQKIQQLRSKIFLVNSKIYFLKEKIDEDIQQLGIQNYSLITQNIQTNKNQHEDNDEFKNPLFADSFVNKIILSDYSQCQFSRANLQRQHEALFNHINENEKVKRAKDQAIANLLEEFQYTKKNLNVYRDKNLLQQKVIQNQRQSIQELRKLVDQAQHQKQQKKKEKQKLEFIARQLSKSSPSGHKFSKILSNLAQGRVVDIQKQFYSLNTEQIIQDQSISSSQAFGPSNHEQDIMVSNVYKWCPAKGIEQLHHNHIKNQENQLKPENQKIYFTQNKKFLRPKQEQSPLVGTAIDVLANDQGSKQDHHHHNYLYKKKTSFEQQIVPVLGYALNSIQYPKSEQLNEKLDVQSFDTDEKKKNAKKNMQLKLASLQVNQVIYNSSVKIEQLSQLFKDSGKNQDEIHIF